mmetsp:Transcript_13105/g.38122  ORF Transcript_13105/g.38122 Transcript_13105/m.38122 type:complete len:86 (-) Transcript_13105:650-907(-)
MDCCHLGVLSYPVYPEVRSEAAADADPDPDGIVLDKSEVEDPDDRGAAEPPSGELAADVADGAGVGFASVGMSSSNMARCVSPIF